LSLLCFPRFHYTTAGGSGIRFKTKKRTPEQCSSRSIIHPVMHNAILLISHVHFALGMNQRDYIAALARMAMENTNDI